MNKKILHTFVIAFLLVMVGCKSSQIQTTTPPVDPQRTPLELAIGKVGGEVSVQQSITATRAAGGPGHIMIDLPDFATTKLALYGVSDDAGVQDWATAARVLDTLEATVATDGTIIFTSADNRKFYPSTGMLSLYSLYPSPAVADSPVEIADDGVNPVIATITVAPTFAQQYDILHAKNVQATAAHADSLKMNFEHVMTQIRFKVYRDDDVTGRLTKIELRGVSKATMNITDIALTPSVDPLDSTDYIAYDGVPVEIEKTAKLIGTDPLMLIPGKGIFKTVTLTVDGNIYQTTIPSDLDFKQGKINTLTLRLKKMGVRFEGVWTVAEWGKGEDHSGDLENNGKSITVSAKMLNAAKGTYAGTAPTFADIEIDGYYTHKGIAVTTTGGVFTSVKFNTGIIHDEPITLSGLKLYSGADYATATPIFDGKLKDGLTVDQRKIVIDTINSGRIQIMTGQAVENYDINMDFGGFGAGTQAIPYEVASAVTLANIAKFPGSATASTFTGNASDGAYFIQVADVDLKNEQFTPITLDGGMFDGNGYKIKNLYVSDRSGRLALFAKLNNTRSILRSIVIESGLVEYTGPSGGTYVSGIVCELYNGKLINCSNSATIKGGSAEVVAGIAARVRNGGQVTGCANFGAVDGRLYVGGVVGDAIGGSQIIDCYNAAPVAQFTPGNHYGGVVGRVAIVSAKTNKLLNCYTTGDVTSDNLTTAGSVAGSITGAYDLPADFKNLYYLTGTHEKSIGSDGSKGKLAASRITELTKEQLKAAAMVDALNAGRTGSDAMWKEDLPPVINNGYPILVWQK